MLKPIQANLNQMCLFLCTIDRHKHCFTEMLKSYAYPII